MSRNLALEIDGPEARALLLTAAWQVDKALTIPLPAAAGDETDDAARQAVVECLSAAGISRSETIALFARADVELRLLNLPPAPESELPGLVGFQIAQELPNFDADTPFDYLPLNDAPGQPWRILAAAPKAEAMRRVRSICRDLKLSLNRVVLRPAAAVSLVLREKPELADKCCLLIEAFGPQIEFAAINRGRISLLRNVILHAAPADAPQAAEDLIAQLRRTIVAVADQERVETVEPVVLIGAKRDRDALEKRIGSAIGSPVMTIDLQSKTASERAWNARPRPERERFAALLGAVAEEAEERRPAFDFINPRRPPEPPSRRNTYVLAGLAAAAVILTLVVFNWLQTGRLKAELSDLKNKAAAMDKEIRAADKTVTAANEVESWLQDEVVWLDELRWLSEQFLPAEDAMLTKLSAGSTGGRRELWLDGLASSEDAVAALDRGLNDDSHRVAGKTKSANPSDGRYRIQFRSSVRIEPRKPQ